MKKTAFILVFALLLLFGASACSHRDPTDPKTLKRGICTIPDNEAGLIEGCAALRRTETTYLPDRTEEIVDALVYRDCALLVRKVSYGKGSDKVTACVADVYIDSMAQFMGYVCRDGNKKITNTPSSEVIAETNALLLINADYLTARRWGFYVRAGEDIRNKGTEGVDLCLIGADGVMKTVNGDDFDVSAAMKDENLYHVFCFGPSLLNEDGSPRSEDSEFHITDKYSRWNEYESSVGFPVPNPRTAIGQAKDGHFIFVTVDGRMSGYSRGVNFPELSHILYEEGAAVAYNLDGGGSEIMCLEGKELTRQYSEDAKRIPSDYICILSEREPPQSGKDGNKEEN